MLPARWSRFASIVAAASALAACGDVDVPVAKTKPKLQELLRPLACASVDDTVDSPVKVLVALDASGSMAFTDPDNRRVDAIADYIADAESRTSDTRFAIMKFGTTLSVDPLPSPAGPLFVPAGTIAPPAIPEGDVHTDMQAMLEGVEQHLRIDMQRTDPAELAVTRYVVTVFTDGQPTPVCCNADDEALGEFIEDETGCPAIQLPVGEGQVRCDGSIESSFCNDENILVRLRENNAPGVDYGDGPREVFAGFSAGSDRNRLPQLRDLVDGIHDLAVEFGVASLEVHVGYLYDPTLPDDVKSILVIDECRAPIIASSIADEDGFEQYLSPDDIDLTIFNARPLCQRRLPADSLCTAFCEQSRVSLESLVESDDDLCARAAVIDAGTDCAACEDAFAGEFGVAASFCGVSG